MHEISNPTIIQGGMGVAVSGWKLAKAVSVAGQLGVVSGTALDAVLVRRLQDGDREGDIRRAMAEFPFPDMISPILKKYFLPEGRRPNQPYRLLSLLGTSLSQLRQELLVVANFVEVFLAKEEHIGLVGINYLEKIQLPLLPSLFGAVLAGVDYVLMGAGIPIAIPGVLNKLCNGEDVSMPLHVNPSDRGPSITGQKFEVEFSPNGFTDGRIPILRRPKFFPIVASATLASMLMKKSSAPVDGFIVEGPTAGGHNAPPRGALQLNDRGEPIYGERDKVDLAAMRSMGLPFWLAGSYGSPEQVAAALEEGASGVQVGTAFAFCDESGMDRDTRLKVIQASKAGNCQVKTDPLASPTGFPFKVFSLDGSLSEASVFAARCKRCDLGFLRQAYVRDDGTLGWRCPAEPESSYLRKGGKEEDILGRKCLCNGLMSAVGLGQVLDDGTVERPIVTCGDEVRHICQFLRNEASDSYRASDVIEWLLSSLPASSRAPSHVTTCCLGPR